MTHYDVLGVPRSAGAAAIRAAYRRRARDTHPDTGGSADEFAAVSQAWLVLSSPAARARYDDELDGAAGWGEEVGLDVSFGSYAPASPAVPWDPPKGAVPDRTDVAVEGATADGPLDPFTSGPLPLPPLELELAALGLPPAMPSTRALATGGVVFVLPLVCALVLVALGEDFPVEDGLRALLLGPAMLAAIAYARMRMAVVRRRDQWTSGALLWLGVFFATVLGLAFAGVLEPWPGPGQVVRHAAVAAVCLVGFYVVVWRVERHARRSRRWFAATDAAVDRDWRAAVWNVLLEVRAEAGDEARIRRLVSRWVRAPRGWELVDGAGDRLTTAPPGAPEAWVARARAGGFEVRDASVGRGARSTSARSSA